MTDIGLIQDNYVTYTPEEEAVRRDLIAMIEAERRAYIERIEPFVKRLAAIPGRQVFFARHERLPTWGGLDDARQKHDRR